MKPLISTRLRDMALRYDYEDRPLLIEAAEALERHLVARLEEEAKGAVTEALPHAAVEWLNKPRGVEDHDPFENGYYCAKEEIKALLSPLLPITKGETK